PPVTVVEIGNGNADAAGSMHEAVVADINADMPVATAGAEKHQIAGIQVIERNGTAPLGLGARGTRQRQVADTGHGLFDECRAVDTVFVGATIAIGYPCPLVVVGEQGMQAWWCRVQPLGWR